MNTEIIDKLNKYVDENSYSELAELLEYCKNEVAAEFGFESYKLIESGTGLEGLDRSSRAIIFEINGECFALMGFYSSWDGVEWRGIDRCEYKQVTVNRYHISGY